jgi:hypothetical protein
MNLEAKLFCKASFFPMRRRKIALQALPKKEKPQHIKKKYHKELLVKRWRAQLDSFIIRTRTRTSSSPRAANAACCPFFLRPLNRIRCGLGPLFGFLRIRQVQPLTLCSNWVMMQLFHVKHHTSAATQPCAVEQRMSQVYLSHHIMPAPRD